MPLTKGVWSLPVPQAPSPADTVCQWARAGAERALTGHVVLLEAVSQLQRQHCLLPAVLHLLQQQKQLEGDASLLLLCSPWHRYPVK